MQRITSMESSAGGCGRSECPVAVEEIFDRFCRLANEGSFKQHYVPKHAEI